MTKTTKTKTRSSQLSPASEAIARICRTVVLCACGDAATGQLDRGSYGLDGGIVRCCSYCRRELHEAFREERELELSMCKCGGERFANLAGDARRCLDCGRVEVR